MSTGPASIRALVVFPGQDQAFIQRIARPSGEDSLYRPLSDLVGGMIEQIRFSDEASAFLNEEGKMLSLPRNMTADRLCAVAEVGLLPWDWIAGTFVVVGALDEHGDLSEWEHDVPESVLDVCRRAGVEIVER